LIGGDSELALEILMRSLGGVHMADKTKKWGAWAARRTQARTEGRRPHGSTFVGRWIRSEQWVAQPIVARVKLAWARGLPWRRSRSFAIAQVEQVEQVRVVVIEGGRLGR